MTAENFQGPDKPVEVPRPGAPDRAEPVSPAIPPQPLTAVEGDGTMPWEVHSTGNGGSPDRSNVPPDANINRLLREEAAAEDADKAGGAKARPDQEAPQPDAAAENAGQEPPDPSAADEQQYQGAHRGRTDDQTQSDQQHETYGDGADEQPISPGASAAPPPFADLSPKLRIVLLDALATLIADALEGADKPAGDKPEAAADKAPGSKAAADQLPPPAESTDKKTEEKTGPPAEKPAETAAADKTTEEQAVPEQPVPSEPEATAPPAPLPTPTTDVVADTTATESSLDAATAAETTGTPETPSPSAPEVLARTAAEAELAGVVPSSPYNNESSGTSSDAAGRTIADSPPIAVPPADLIAPTPLASPNTTGEPGANPDGSATGQPEITPIQADVPGQPVATTNPGGTPETTDGTATPASEAGSPQAEAATPEHVVTTVDGKYTFEVTSEGGERVGQFYARGADGGRRKVGEAVRIPSDGGGAGRQDGAMEKVLNHVRSGFSDYQRTVAARRTAATLGAAAASADRPPTSFTSERAAETNATAASGPGLPTPGGPAAASGTETPRTAAGTESIAGTTLTNPEAGIGGGPGSNEASAPQSSSPMSSSSHQQQQANRDPQPPQEQEVPQSAAAGQKSGQPNVQRRHQPETTGQRIVGGLGQAAAGAVATPGRLVQKVIGKIESVDTNPNGGYVVAISGRRVTVPGPTKLLARIQARLKYMGL